MTLKFRIYDKEVGYYVSNTRFLLSMDGQLLDTYDTTWYEVGERYVVEYSNGVLDIAGKSYFVGDVVQTDNIIDSIILIDGIIHLDRYDNGDEYNRYCPWSTRWNEFEIIGTIHDEKYKGL